ncbi:DUF6264 family protein [Leifsonia sp. NPDC014704]|uniref:DUF6264 family protein n=1 Tax=Leifsonia sp. NPDC014704 TaxID=3364123 RepID=UPI0036F46D9A
MAYEAHDPWEPTDQPERQQRSGGVDLSATITLLVLMTLMGLLLSFTVVLEQMGVAGCSAAPAACDYALIGITTWITPVALALGLAGTIAGLVARARTGRRSWWVPLVGLVIVIVAFVVASLLVFQATHP